MHEQAGRRVARQGFLDHLARMHGGAIECAAEQLLALDEAMAVVELWGALHNWTYVLPEDMWSRRRLV